LPQLSSGPLGRTTAAKEIYKMKKGPLFVTACFLAISCVSCKKETVSAIVNPPADTYYSSDTTISINLLYSREVTTTSIHLIGEINAHGKSVSYYFVYGLAASYGLKTPETALSGDFLANVTLNNLKYGSQYHWRLRCRTVDGELWSNDFVTTTSAIMNPVEFSYPLTVGTRWNYAYHLTAEYVYGAITPPSEVRNGTRVWEILSKSVVADSTIYELKCTASDTIMRRIQENTPPDTNYEYQAIPFRIVVAPNTISVEFYKTVFFATGNRSAAIIPIPRFVENGTTQLQLGNVLYVNGIGLKQYSAGFFSNTGGYLEQLILQ